MADARTGSQPTGHTGEPHASRPTSSPAIHEMADTGHYPIRGLGARRKLPTFDDLVFLTASVSRYPLEGYRERCETATVARHPSRRQTD